MRLVLRDLDQNTVATEIEDTKTVFDLKTQIENETEKKYLADTQTIIYNGSILQNEQPLYDYQIDEQKFLVLLSGFNMHNANQHGDSDETDNIEAQITAQQAHSDMKYSFQPIPIVTSGSQLSQSPQETMPIRDPQLLLAKYREILQNHSENDEEDIQLSKRDQDYIYRMVDLGIPLTDVLETFIAINQNINVEMTMEFDDIPDADTDSADEDNNETLYNSNINPSYFEEIEDSSDDNDDEYDVDDMEDVEEEVGSHSESTSEDEDIY